MVQVSIKKKFIFLLVILICNFISFSNEIFSSYEELKDYKGEILRYGEYEKKGNINYNKKTGEKFTGRTYDLYSNGRLDGTAEYINGVKTGTQYEYYQTGQLKFKIQYQYGERNGKFLGYYQTGKLSTTREYKSGIMQSMVEYYEDGKTVKRMFKLTEGLKGIMTLYFKGSTKIRAESSLIPKHEEINGQNWLNYTADGLSKFYDKKGNLEAILEFDNGSTENMPLKYYYLNGNLRYYTLMGKNPMDFQNKYIEYYDNGQEKQNCNQLTSGSWSCKQYTKDGKFKGEKTGSQRSQSFGNFVINALLGVFNILTH